MIEINYEALEQLSISDLLSLREYFNYRIRISKNSDEVIIICKKIESLQLQLDIKTNNLFII